MANYELPAEVFSPGTTINPKLDKVPFKGPGGGWNVVDRLVLWFQVDCTVAGAQLIGADQWRALNRLRLKIPGRTFLDLTGPQLRAAIHAECESMIEADPANIAVGNGTIDVKFIIPFTPVTDKSYHDSDYGLVVAGWRHGGGEIEITCAGLGDFTQGASSVSALATATKSVRIFVECHEEEKPSYKFLARWFAQKASPDSEPVLTVNGLLRWAFLHGTGATGGLALTAGSVITDITSEAYGEDNYDATVKLETFNRQRVPASNDIFVNAHAYPLVFPKRLQRAHTRMRQFNGPLTWKFGGTLSNYNIVAQVLEPMSGAAMDLQAKRQGITATKIATKGKTLTSKDYWGRVGRRAILPKKAVTGGRG